MTPTVEERLDDLEARFEAHAILMDNVIESLIRQGVIDPLALVCALERRVSQAVDPVADSRAMSWLETMARVLSDQFCEGAEHVSG